MMNRLMLDVKRRAAPVGSEGIGQFNEPAAYNQRPHGAGLSQALAETLAEGRAGVAGSSHPLSPSVGPGLPVDREASVSGYLRANRPLPEFLIHRAMSSAAPFAPTSGLSQIMPDADPDGLEKSPRVDNAARQAGTALYLDGNSLGRWMVRYLEDGLARPPSGTNAIDPRAVSGWSSSPIFG